MLAVVVVALAVPLAVLLLGIRGFSPKPAASAPEAPGLRAAVELAASKNLPPPAPLGTDTRQFVLLPGQGNPLERWREIEKSADMLGGTTLLVGQPDGGSRLLVQIPAAAAASFEERALAGLNSSAAPDPAEGPTRLYEILFPPP